MRLGRTKGIDPRYGIGLGMVVAYYEYRRVLSVEYQAFIISDKVYLVYSVKRIVVVITLVEVLRACCQCLLLYRQGKYPCGVHAACGIVHHPDVDVLRIG